MTNGELHDETQNPVVMSRKPTEQASQNPSNEFIVVQFEAMQTFPLSAKVYREYPMLQFEQIT